jgi:hypothetical protein
MQGPYDNITKKAVLFHWSIDRGYLSGRRRGRYTEDIPHGEVIRSDSEP